MPQNKQPGGGLYAWYSLTACDRTHRTAGIIVTVRSAGARSVPYVTVSAGWLAGWVIVGRVGRYITALCFLSCRPLARSVAEAETASGVASRRVVSTKWRFIVGARRPHASRRWHHEDATSWGSSCTWLDATARGLCRHVSSLGLSSQWVRAAPHHNAVIGYNKNEMATLHLIKTYCVPSTFIMDGYETWNLDGKEYCRLSVIWNNAYHRI